MLHNGLWLGKFEQNALQNELGHLQQRPTGWDGQRDFRPILKSRKKCTHEVLTD